MAMSSRFQAQRLAVLVDTAYVYAAARRLYDERLDYKRLLAFVADGRPVVRAIAFVVRQGEADVGPFVEALRAVGFEVRVRDRRRHLDGWRGEWDVGLALTAAALAPRVDAVALVAGSADFVDLLDHLEVAGTRAEVYGFAEAVDGELVDAAHDFRPLDGRLMLD